MTSDAAEDIRHQHVISHRTQDTIIITLTQNTPKILPEFSALFLLFGNFPTTSNITPISSHCVWTTAIIIHTHEMEQYRS